VRAPGLYRFLAGNLPLPAPRLSALGAPASSLDLKGAERVLRRHRSLGGALAFFDENGLIGHLVYGPARRGMPVNGETAFRLASVSKLVTAAGVMRLRQRGALDADADLEGALPFSLRHPAAPERPVTLRMLMTHTAGIRDGRAYLDGLARGADAETLLAGDSHTDHLPGEGCEYSNFGVGLAGCAVEALLGVSFERAMQSALFEPLGIGASYYPALLAAPVADARRLLPPRLRPNFDGAARQAAPAAGWDAPDPQRHYALAHGSCCMDVAGLARLGAALLKPGFFKEETLLEMRRPHASLGQRDPTLRQGVGLFILEDASIAERPLYGHQGMAYGAVNMLFMDLEKNRGIISLTRGASEAREHIVADLNKDLLRWWLAHG